MSFIQGEMVGSYRIVEQLGQGGMATVYKAYHASLDRYVALKVLHPAFLEDKNFQARFQREARLVAKLEHPNIVPIYDYSEHEGRPYLVMKYIEGVTLKARLSAAPIIPSEIERIVRAVGAGLDYAHKHGILHRDIKPSNVLLANDGQIYLADFGLARIAQSGESTLTSDMILGTPQYISPEQAMGKKNLDEGTDIYSFGVMLYELTVGQVPFSADTPFSVIHDHIYTPLPLPSKVNPAISLELERVLLKSLAKERHDRYKDVAALVEAFTSAWQKISHVDLTVSRDSALLPDVESANLVEDQMTLPPVSPNIQPNQAPPETISVSGQPEFQAAHQEIGVKPKGKKIPWMWIAVLVIFFLCCIITAGALRQGN
jgi:serine/threonine protein kinase